MATYEIQVRTPYGWRADPDYLGDADNRWPTEAAAQVAINELATLAGFDPKTLRIKEI